MERLRHLEHRLANMVEPEALRRINLSLLLFWAVMAIVGLVTPIGDSVTYVVLISHIALIQTAGVGWIAARAEVEAKRAREQTQ